MIDGEAPDAVMSVGQPDCTPVGGMPWKASYGSATGESTSWEKQGKMPEFSAPVASVGDRSGVPASWLLPGLAPTIAGI